MFRFSYDIFSFTRAEKIIVSGIDENTDGTITLEIANMDYEKVNRVKEILKETIKEIEDIKESFSMDGSWLLTFKIPDGILENYESTKCDAEDLEKRWTSLY